MSTLTSWILGIMLGIASPATVAPLRNNESVEDMQVRYASIAEDLTTVLDETKPLFPEPYGKEKTAALVLSIMKFESDFDVNVDNGTRRGDSGRSWCLMQINVGKGTVYLGDEEMRSWHGPDLVEDRKKCLKAGLAILRESLIICRRSGADRLSVYTSGTCQAEKAARHRWEYGQYLFRSSKTALEVLLEEQRSLHEERPQAQM